MCQNETFVNMTLNIVKEYNVTLTRSFKVHDEVNVA